MHVPPCSQIKTLQTLIGVCAISLSNFSTTLPDDEKLLHPGLALATGEDGSAAADASTAAPAAAASAPPSEDVATAIGFRMAKKRILVAAMQALTERVKRVPGIKGLKEAGVPAAKKGEKPKAATDKGFGSK